MLKWLGDILKKWGEKLSPSKKDIEIRTEQIFTEACKDCLRVRNNHEVEKTQVEEHLISADVTSYPVVYFERKQNYPTKFSLYEILEDNNTGDITVVFEHDNSKPARKTRSGNYSLINDQGKVITVRRHTILKIVETYKNTAGHEYYRKPN